MSALPFRQKRPHRQLELIDAIVAPAGPAAVAFSGLSEHAVPVKPVNAANLHMRQDVLPCQAVDGADVDSQHLGHFLGGQPARPAAAVADAQLSGYFGFEFAVFGS